MSTTLTIAVLYEALKKQLGFEWITGEELGDHTIQTAADATGEVSLVGNLNLINQHRIQVLGNKELNYLDSLKKNSRKDTISQLYSGQSDLVIIARRLRAPADLTEAAAASRIPMLSSRLASEETIQHVRYFLGNHLAEKITLHGVFMEVMGTGVLITGASGIGKSELALELLTRGHRLIADDAIEYARIAPDILNGTCPEMLQDFLEVRGLGVLNVRAMFGASAIKHDRYLRLVILLQEMHSVTGMDRLQGSRRTRTLLGVEIPEITLPVGPGRNLSVLVEAAVRNHILRTKGYDASQAFIDRQKQRLDHLSQ
jgi:HPr kinase/phosphorylase